MFQDEVDLSGLGAVRLTPERRARMREVSKAREKRRKEIAVAKARQAAKRKKAAKGKPTGKVKAAEPAKTNWVPLALAAGAAYFLL